MLLSAETQLVGLAVALYLLDSVTLLHVNEGMLTRHGPDRWSLSLGFANARVLGKNIFVPNLLAPHQPVFRLRWSFEHAGPALHQVEDVAPAFRALGWASLWLACVQFLLFPAVLFFFLNDRSLVGTIALLYATICGNLYLLYRSLGRLGMDRKKFMGLCFECLVCPPLAVNLVRRVSLDRYKDLDLVCMADKVLDARGRALANTLFRSRLEDQLAVLEEGQAQSQLVAARLAAFAPTDGASHELG